MRIADYYKGDPKSSMVEIKKKVEQKRIKETRYSSIEVKSKSIVSRDNSLNDRSDSPAPGKIFHTNQKNLKVEYID